ncbi:hypothetical protein ACVW00_001637 [Marmoricola sp. URHA0025 HA25]
MIALGRTERILVVTDHADPTTELVAAIQERAEAGDVQFRIIVLNPARAEIHLLHPERHDKAREAEQALLRALPTLEAAAGGPVLGSVSVRHDPMDAIEEVLFNEPIDEIILSVPAHHLASRLHQDLEHRLQHFELPVRTVHASSGA